MLTGGNSISAYLDDLRKLKVHTDPSKNTDIARVGIRVDHKTSEFKPIKMGHVPLSPEMPQKKEIYYHLYYPISELAYQRRPIILLLMATSQYFLIRSLCYHGIRPI